MVETKNEATEAALLKVIETLEDGQKGFAEIGNGLQVTMH